MKLTAAGQTALQNKIIGQYYRFYIDDVVNNDVIDYQFSYNLEFGSASLEIELENSDGRYSPGGASEIDIGAAGELKEGILVSGSYEVFSKFKGILRQRQYSKSAGKNTIKFMFLDYIVKLQEMDIGGTHTDQIFDSLDKVTVTSTGNVSTTYQVVKGTGATDTMTYNTVNVTIGSTEYPPCQVWYLDYSDIKTTLTAADFTRNGAPNCGGYFSFFDHKTGRLVLTVVNSSTDVFVCTTNYSFAISTLTPNPISTDGMSSQSQIFNFVYSNIAPTPEPIVRILRQIDAEDFLGQPVFSGYEINYETGQLTLNVPINYNEYKVVADYWYYPTGTYVEDWIESVIIQADVFGNTPFTATTNLRTTYQVEEGTGSTDTMTLNTSTVTYGGSDYTAGKVGYVDYDNVQTTLTASDFTVNGSPLNAGQFVAFDARFGRLFMNISHTGDEIICTNNYQFSTLQATGIYIPYIDLTTRSVANRFDAIKKLKDCLAPNYILSTKGGNKIWGRYLADKTTADYTLRLEKSLTYAEDIKDIYTRVKLYGQSNSPTNLMCSKYSEFTKGFTYSVHVDEVPLSQEGTWQNDNWIIYGFSTLSGAMGIDTTKPIKVWFDDVLLGGANSPFERTFAKVTIENNAPNDSTQSSYRIWFTDADLQWDNNHPITFYDSNGTNMYVLDRNNTIWDGTNYLYKNSNGSSSGVPVFLDTVKGNWQIPANMSNNERFVYVGLDQSFLGLQALSFTAGADYSLRFDYYAGNRGFVHLGIYHKTNYDGRTDLVGDHDLTTAHLDNWGVPSATEAGIGIDGGYFSYEYPLLSNFYAIWDAAYDWVPCTINGGYYYWIRIATTRTPTSAAIIKQLGAIFSWGNPANRAFNKVLTYRTDTNTFEDYTTACGIGNASMPFLEVGSFQQSVSHARYWVFHPSNQWQIPTIAPYYTNKFALYAGLFSPEAVMKANEHTVKASFDYMTTTPEATTFGKLYDGDSNTQYQLELISPLAAGQTLFTVVFKNETTGLPELKDIDAIDITAGFFNPENDGYIGKGALRYDINNWLSIQYSVDGLTYNYINKETYNFALSGGESKSFEASVLGEGFQAMYLRLIIEQSSMVDYQNGRWVIAITDFSVWTDIIIKADAKLGAANVIPTTTDPTSTVADPNSLRTTIGEKVYKVNEINKNSMTNLSTGMRAYNLLTEYVKNATRVSVDVAYSPHLELGQTVKVIDSVNGTNRNYFIEGLSNSKGAISLQLAYYP